MPPAARTLVFRSGARALHYRRSGQAQGRPVVLIHGLSGSARWWRYNLPALEARYRVYVVELVGYGAARHQRALGVHDSAALLAEWLDELNLDGVALIGHSMGGHISLLVAARRPQRVGRLVLACASGLLHAKWWRLALKLPSAALVGRLAFVPTIVADGLRAGLRNVWRSSRDLLRDDVAELLPALAVPTLVIWGDRDVIVPPALGQAVAQAIPGARFVSLRGAGHVVMVDAAGAFNHEVLRFLDTPLPGSPRPTTP